MTLVQLDLPALRRWAIAARAELAAHAASLDRLNVFPVPDGDTGTNLLLTLDEALRELLHDTPDTLSVAAADLARASLTSARGNSGVILSQLVRGVAEIAAQEGVDGRGGLDGGDLARALRASSDYARAGVSRPVEGTVLTVAAAAAGGAEQAVAGGGDLEAVATAAVREGVRALMTTQEQLPALREAGVVDAGGAGYVLLLESLQRVVRGLPGLSTPATDPPEWLLRTPLLDADRVRAQLSCRVAADGPAYEVMYLLEDSDDGAVAAMRARLDELGDSVVVAGGPELWTVHAHVDDVAAALEAGAAAGRPHRFSVTRFADQRSQDDPGQDGGAGRGTVGVLAVVDGPGLVDLVRAHGGTAVDLTERQDPASVAALLRTAGPDVLALASGPAAESVLVAAIRQVGPGTRVELVGNHPAHIVAVLAVLDRDRGLPEAATAAREVVAGVSTALWSSVESLDQTLLEVSAFVQQRGGELVTLVLGRSAPTGAAEALEARLRTDHPEVEVTTVHSDALGAALAVGVE